MSENLNTTVLEGQPLKHIWHPLTINHGCWSLPGYVYISNGPRQAINLRVDNFLCTFILVEHPSDKIWYASNGKGRQHIWVFLDQRLQFVLFFFRCVGNSPAMKNRTWTIWRRPPSALLSLSDSSQVSASLSPRWLWRLFLFGTWTAARDLSSLAFGNQIYDWILLSAYNRLYQRRLGGDLFSCQGPASEAGSSSGWWFAPP